MGDNIEKEGSLVRTGMYDCDLEFEWMWSRNGYTGRDKRDS